jgi:hypothetical protein
LPVPFSFFFALAGIEREDRLIAGVLPGVAWFSPNTTSLLQVFSSRNYCERRS